MADGERTGWLTLSSPALDRPLVPSVERLAKHLRAAAALIEDAQTTEFEKLYKPTRPGLGFSLPSIDRPRRSAWALIGEWLVGWAVGAHGGDASLSDAHSWFWQGRDVGELRDDRISRPLSHNLATSSEIRALLPYLLDPGSLATRRDVLGAQASHRERAARKKSGIYYTPGDVAHHMVTRTMTGATSGETTWFDPAHGSGVFLRAALSLSDEPDVLRDHLYGIDLDPYAAESTSFVLTVEDLLTFPNGHAPWRRWHRFRRNLATGNSLFIESANPLAGDVRRSKADGEPYGQDSTWRIGDPFPEIENVGFSRIIANPPYAKLEQHLLNAKLPAIHPSTGAGARADISPVFVEVCLDLLAADGSMTAVTPLSTVTSTRSPFPQLRERLSEEPGRVDLASYDRMPDALFGDDIKTRNAVIHVNRAEPHAFNATPLHRWTSRKRNLALGGAPLISVLGLPNVPALIPKIGSQWERDLYLACTGYQFHVDSWVRQNRSAALSVAAAVDNAHWSKTISVAPTAYNFLGVTRDPARAVQAGHDSENAVALMSFNSPREASAAYALLASRAAFWLWHVTGDGFHTTARLPRLIPAPIDFDAVDRFAELGDQLWQLVQGNPLVSLNRGRTTIAYPAWVYGEQIDRIDREVDSLLGTTVASNLAEWHERLVVVDPGSNRVEKVKRKTK